MNQNFRRILDLPGWLIRQFLLAIIHVYRYAISPFLGPRCRFHPSCSAYAAESLTRYGLLKGLWLTTKRILRCLPFHPVGYDALP